MLGIVLKADLKTANKADLIKFINGFMKREMIKAVKEFLKIALNKIPKRTGFLRGSFTNIVKRFNVPGTGAGTGGYWDKREWYYPGKGTKILKTPITGIKYATDPNDVLTSTQTSIRLRLGSDINYYEPNDQGTRVPSPPWLSLQSGSEAMILYLQSAFKRFPSITKVLGTLVIHTDKTIRKRRINPNVDSIITTEELLIKGFN